MSDLKPTDINGQYEGIAYNISFNSCKSRHSKMDIKWQMLLLDLVLNRIDQYLSPPPYNYGCIAVYQKVALFFLTLILINVFFFFLQHRNSLSLIPHM